MGPQTAAFQEYTGLLTDHPEAQGGLSWALEQAQWARTMERADDEHLTHSYSSDSGAG